MRDKGVFHWRLHPEKLTLCTEYKGKLPWITTDIDSVVTHLSPNDIRYAIKESGNGRFRSKTLRFLDDTILEF
jgi:hypothetical protein